MLMWILFIAFVLVMVSIDLGIFNRTPRIIGVKEASLWTSLWVSLALLFSLVVYWVYSNGLVLNPNELTPGEAMLTYITGYLIELSLSVDNIFVIAVIFSSFQIPLIYQHRVLFWGILGAIVFRASLILFGIVLINKISWMIYLFGLFLLFTVYKMYRSRNKEFNPRQSFTFRQLKRFIPISNSIEGEKFFVQLRHIKAATPLFVALIVIEVTDVIFALDSIPAIIAITSDPFLVFTSNIMAILGLRSMYFFLSNMLDRFAYLEYSLMVILAFVGIKMLLGHLVSIPHSISLGFILVALVSGVLGSIWFSKKDTAKK